MSNTANILPETTSKRKFAGMLFLLVIQLTLMIVGAIQVFHWVASHVSVTLK